MLDSLAQLSRYVESFSICQISRDLVDSNKSITATRLLFWAGTILIREIR